MTTPNVELLEKTLSYIEEHPAEWYQGEWCVRTEYPDGKPTYYAEDEGVKSPCGTAMCFAGTALKLSGYKPVFYSYDEETTRFIKDGEDNFVDVEDEAAKVLGLDFKKADTLFDYNNKLDDLRRIVKEYTGKENASVDSK